MKQPLKVYIDKDTTIIRNPDSTYDVYMKTAGVVASIKNVDKKWIKSHFSIDFPG